MVLPIRDIIILGIGFVYFIFFMILFVKSRKYDTLFEVLDEKEYPFKECYSIGYALVEMTKYSYKSKKDRKRKSQYEILFGKKYCEYYLRVAHAQMATYALLIVLLAFPVYCLAREVSIFVIMLALAGFAYYYCGDESQRRIDKRSEQMLSDFAESVSKMSLLVNAGMVLREAWYQVAYGTDGLLYDEMRIAYDGMKNGQSDSEAIYKFGIRCVVPEMKKFSSTIVQSLEKGGGDLTLLLMDQSTEMWNAKKQLVKREGERASSKLMIPMFLMLAGILIMIVVPIFSNLGV